MMSLRGQAVPVHAKITSYQVNGSGRDTYISFNNGGITTSSKVSGFSVPGSQTRPSSANRSGSVRLEAKTLHYHSDGTGRDNYIVINEGGLTNGWNPRKGSNFLSSLRAYERIRPYTRDRIDYFDWAQRSLTVKEVEESRQRVNTIKTMVDRLAVPKTTGLNFSARRARGYSSDRF